MTTHEFMRQETAEEFMRQMQQRADRHIYELKMKLFESEEYQRFEATVTLLEVRDFGAQSMIRFTMNDNEEALITDKPKAFWDGLVNKKVNLLGSRVLDEDENVDLIVEECQDISFLETLKKYNLSDEVIEKFKAQTKELREVQKLDLLNKYSAVIGTEEDGEITVRYSTIAELQAKYSVIKSSIPMQVRAEIESCLAEHDEASGTDRRTLHKVLKELININWSEQYKEIDVEALEKRLSETHIGMEHAKSMLIKAVKAMNMSKEKKPKVILLTGDCGCGKSSLAQAFAAAITSNFATMNLGGLTDELLIRGSARIYENGKPGLLYRKLLQTGQHGVLILEEIDKVNNTGCVNALLEFISTKVLSDDFLEVPYDVSGVWIIVTANDVQKLPSALLSRMTVINIDAYSNEEKCDMIQQIFLPRVCQEYNLPYNNQRLDKTVCDKIIQEVAGGKSIHEMERAVYEIFDSAIDKGETFPNITTDNFSEYYHPTVDVARIRGEYARELSALDKKYHVCYQDYPDCVKGRIEILFKLAYEGNSEEKEYALSALTVLVNILNEEVKDIDIAALEKALNKNHYGLEETKKEILKLATAYKLSKEPKFTPILLNGCAGVGKTTLAKSIAEAWGRKFIKISLNGISDSDIINGFTRTYKDAEPGIIAKGLSQPDICSYNAVVLLDEIDKMSVGAKGDPYAALHNLLDNTGGFYDKYLAAELPMKNILFICTSNDKRKLPNTILDRMSCIDVGGYTLKEKRTITTEYVLPHVAEKYHLDSLLFEESAMKELLNGYCTSYGIRDVERAIESIVTTLGLKNKCTLDKNVTVDLEAVKRSLGAKPANQNDFPENTSVCGQARALAVAGNYGTTFAVQITENRFAEEAVEVTGLAKGSCLESIKVAMSCASRILERKIPNIHVHFSDAGVEKDGPSAGITVLMALLSCMLKKPIPNVGFTGTIDLFGNIGTIGGAKLKCAAAELAGVETVYLPVENYQRLVDANELDKFSLEIVPVKNVYEVTERIFGNTILKGRR